MWTCNCAHLWLHPSSSTALAGAGGSVLGPSVWVRLVSIRLPQGRAVQLFFLSSLFLQHLKGVTVHVNARCVTASTGFCHPLLGYVAAAEVVTPVHVGAMVTQDKPCYTTAIATAVQCIWLRPWGLRV